MSNKKMFLASLAGLILAATASHGVQLYSYADLAGASIQFNGSANSFQFVTDPVTGYQWSITGESGGSGALNLDGSFTGGPWYYGTVSTIGGVQTATVDPPSATLVIYDGASYQMTANVEWVDISEFLGVGGINGNLAVDVSDLSYAGSNPDLSSFSAATSGILNLSFQFDPAMTLQQLSAGSGPYDTSFTGTLQPVPEPTSLLVLGVGLSLLGTRAFFRHGTRRRHISGRP